MSHLFNYCFLYTSFIMVNDGDKNVLLVTIPSQINWQGKINIFVYSLKMVLQ